MNLLFLTYEKAPQLSADDLPVVAVLEARGHKVLPRLWDSVAPETSGSALAVVRSCWDYHERSEEFVDALTALESSGLRVVNSPEIIRWNIDKSYLRELKAKGALIADTAWIERGTEVSLHDVLAEQGFDEAVVKPRISLSAVDTFRVSLASARAQDAQFRELVSRKSVLVQRFVPEIVQGEISLLFFGGVYSHAVRKVPVAGDFRVQSDYGGVRTLIEPERSWVREAERVLSSLPPLVFARVDVVPTSRGLCWMELELTDPELFLRFHPDAPDRFADVILEVATRS